MLPAISCFLPSSSGISFLLAVTNIRPETMSETPRTDASQFHITISQNPDDAGEWLVNADLARQLERELDFSEKTGRQIWSANERLQAELAAERALADRLAEALDGLDWLAASPPQALAAWKEARK